MLGSELFLQRYNEIIQNKVNDKTSLLSILKMISHEEIKSSTTFDYDETISKCKVIKSVVDKIISIIHKPLIKTDVEEVVIRSELSEKLSPYSFKETLKESRFWKMKNGQMTPEYVKNEVSIDTVSSYENAFIAYLTDLLGVEINDLILEISPLVESLEEKYEIKGATYGRRSLFQELGNEYLHVGEFKTTESNSYEALSLLKKLEKRIIHIKSSENYRLFKLFPLNKDIIPTNILIHNQLYNYCYKYYLDNYKNSANRDSFQKEKNYYQYVISLLLTYIYDNDLKHNLGKVSFKEITNTHLLNFSKLQFHDEDFLFVLTQDEETTGFEIEVTFQKEIVTRYYFYVRYSYDDTNSHDIEYFIKKKKETYDDVILITMNNNKLMFDNTLNLSIYREDNFAMINNLYSSLTMLFVTETELYEHKCPVCGKKHIDFKGEHYECHDCGALYSIVKVDKKQALYIQTLRRR